MGKRITYDIVGGERFGMLTVLKELSRRFNGRQNYRYVLCKCDCGKEVEIRLTSITSENSKSCGCLTRKNDKTNLDTSTHKLSKHSLYHTYHKILNRCYDESNERYHRYGGRGIKVCKEWRKDFISFYNWAMSNGWQKGLQIDRYPNNDGNYEPNNCRVTTSLENNNNRADNVIIMFNGNNVTIPMLARMVNIPYKQLYYRIATKKMTAEQAIKYDS